MELWILTESAPKKEPIKVELPLTRDRYNQIWDEYSLDGKKKSLMVNLGNYLWDITDIDLANESYYMVKLLRDNRLLNKFKGWMDCEMTNCYYSIKTAMQKLYIKEIDCDLPEIPKSSLYREDDFSRKLTAVSGIPWKVDDSDFGVVFYTSDWGTVLHYLDSGVEDATVSSGYNLSLAVDWSPDEESPKLEDHVIEYKYSINREKADDLIDFVSQFKTFLKNHPQASKQRRFEE